MASHLPPSYFGKPRSVISAELQATEDVECPLCHLSPKPFAIDYQGFQLCRCPRCGLEFVSPRLTFEQLAEKVYTDTYCSSDEQTKQDREASNDQFSLQLSAYERLLRHRGTILDVGCGDGSFLHYAQEHGWEIFGTDIGPLSRARELICTLWEGRLREIDFGAMRFDVIRFYQVLEHTQNPREELLRASELLRTGGLIHISVPNIAGLSPRLKSIQSWLRLKSRRWRHYAAMHHLFFFSPRTLSLMIESAGLRVLHWETPVVRKSNALSEKIYRLLLERSHKASILDFYCTLD